MTRLIQLRPFLTLVALALLAPLALFPTPTRFVALLAIPVLWLWRWRVTRNPQSGHLIPRTPLDGAIFWIALMVLVSLYATFDIAFSLPKIAGLVYGIAVFYATVDVAARSRKLLAWAIGLYILMGFGLAGLALIGTRWPAKYPFFEPVVARLPAALRGMPGAEAGFHGNEVAGALLWFIPLALGVAIAAPSLASSRRRFLFAAGSGVALLFMTGILILAQSRGALAGLVVGLLGMLAWLGWWGRGFGLGALGAAAWAAWRIGLARIEGLLFGGGESIEVVGTINLSGRIELWSRALYGIQDFPFTGMGLNTFRRVVHVLYPLFLVGPDVDIGHAHNHFLQVALDLGLPGLIAYVALYGLVLFLLIDVLRSRRDRMLRAVALGAFGSLLAYLVYGITDTVALGAKPGAAFWLLLALVVAVWRRARQPADVE